MKFKRPVRNSKLRVIVDTNVVISAFLNEEGPPAEIIELVLKKIVVAYASTDTIRELYFVLTRAKITNRLEKAETIFSTYIKTLEIIEPENRLENVIEDSSDEKFLECALESRANYIISGDTHLLKLGTFRGIKILTPAEFLKMKNLDTS